MPDENPDPGSDQHRPDPGSDQYLNQVTNRMQGLISGKQPRDPHLSKASTGRLILEGVVENVKIYRLHKEETLREAKETKKKKKKMNNGDGDKCGRSDRRQHRHRDEERRHRSDREEEQHHRHRSPDRRRGRCSGRKVSREHLFNDDAADHDHMVTSGAGPAGTLLSRDLRPEHGPRSRSRSRHRRKPGISSSLTRQHGPDGKTPFGELPKKVAGVGLAAHFLSTYRHIKAEHDAGHRSRSALEKVVDGLKGKTPVVGRLREGEGRSHDHEQPRDDRSRKDNTRRRRDSQGRSNRGRGGCDRNEHRSRGDGRPCDRERGIGQANLNKDLPRQPTGPYAHEEPSQDRSPSHNPELPSHSPRAPSPPPHRRQDEPYNRTLLSQVREAIHPSQSRNASPVLSPTPSRSIPPFRSASPPYPDTPRVQNRSTSPIMPMPTFQSVPVLLHLPLPPMPEKAPARPPPPAPPLPKVAPDRGALLDEISGVASNLKPLRKPDGEPEATYSETSNSRNVEERERVQASNGTWTDEDDHDDDNESARRRVLKEMLRLQFGRVSPVEKREFEGE